MNNSAGGSRQVQVPSGLPPAICRLAAELLRAATNSGCGEPWVKKTAERLEQRAMAELSVDARIFSALPRFVAEPVRRQAPNPALYKQVPPEVVQHWFEKGGTFESVLTGYESRPEQIAMAGAVAEAFSQAKHLVVEAGTGVGKTMAYLVPSVLWALANKLPVVVSTNTKNLQEQIFRKDLPSIVAALRSPIKFALIKGRSNYVCLSRFESMLAHREAELEDPELLDAARALFWIFRTDSGDLTELEQEIGSTQFSAKICSQGEECHGRKCAFYHQCFVQKARARSLSADVVVTNHSVWFAEQESEKPLALPKAAQVVFDEAHNLEDAATNSQLKEFSPHTLIFTLHKILHSRRNKSAKGLIVDVEKLALSKVPVMETDEGRKALLALTSSARENCRRVETSAKRFFRNLAKIPPPKQSTLLLKRATLAAPEWLSITSSLEALQDDLFALASDISVIANIFTPHRRADDGSSTAPRMPALKAPEGASPALARELASLAGVRLDLAPIAISIGSSDTQAAQISSQFENISHRLAFADQSIQELLRNLEFITSIEDESWAYWIEVFQITRTGYTPTSMGILKAAPITVAKSLSENLFQKLDSVVLCSATMTVSGSPDFLAHRLGLDRIDNDRILTSYQGSPFDYEKQCLVAVPMYLPAQTLQSDTPNDRFVQAFAKLVVSAAIASNGRTMVLFTSYRQMESVVSIIRPTLNEAGIVTLSQGSGPSRESLTAEFRAQERPSILLGTDSFWEGVDLIGEALSCLIIAKLPFDAVGDPLVKARAEEVDLAQGNSFMNFSIPNAVIKFRQGFGRLIRHRSDHGVVIVADTRICLKNYGAIFRKNLPVDARKFDSQEALVASVTDFLQTAKQ